MFKTIPKHIKAEGLSLELLNAVASSKMLPSPVQLLPGEEAVTLTKANATEYWAQDTQGQWVRDKRGLIRFQLKDVIIGRARYLNVFVYKEIAEKIDKLYDARKTRLLKKAQELIEKYEVRSSFRTGMHPLSAILGAFDNNQEMIKKHEAERPIIEYIKKLVDQNEVDTLYTIMEQNGLPELGVFQNTDDALMLMHADNIDRFTELLTQKSHMYMVIAIEVCKDYQDFVPSWSYLIQYLCDPSRIKVTPQKA